MNTFVEKASDSDIERARTAGEDIDPELVMESVAHAEKGSTRILGRTPRIGMTEDASSGSFDAPSVAALHRPCSR